MSRRFEKSLSLILIILIMIVFAITAFLILASDVQIQILSHVWSISFMLSWVFMLIYSIYILFQKDSIGFSVFVAIITAISFILLTYHALIMAANYINYLPRTLTVSSNLLILNGQIVFYTALLLVYVLHLINLLKISKINQINTSSKDEDVKKSLDVEENTTEDIYVNNNKY